MLRSLLYAREKVRLPTSYSPTEAVRRLAANVERPTFWMWFTRAMALGTVSCERVVLYRYRPWVHNSFVPVFTGRFEAIHVGAKTT